MDRQSVLTNFKGEFTHTTIIQLQLLQSSLHKTAMNVYSFTQETLQLSPLHFTQ